MRSIDGTDRLPQFGQTGRLKSMFIGQFGLIGHLPSVRDAWDNRASRSPQTVAADLPVVKHKLHTGKFTASSGPALSPPLGGPAGAPRTAIPF